MENLPIDQMDSDGIIEALKSNVKRINDKSLDITANAMVLATKLDDVLGMIAEYVFLKEQIIDTKNKMDTTDFLPDHQRLEAYLSELEFEYAVAFCTFKKTCNLMGFVLDMGYSPLD